MLGLFNIPRVSYNYYRPVIYRRRYVPAESYLLNAIKQMQEYDALQSLLYRSLIAQQKSQNEEIKAENENNQIEKEATEAKTELEPNESKESMPIYYYESHSRYDDGKIVEERKEKKIDSEGKVHHSLVRRLGDQWYQTEKIEDEEGKVVTKEAWHNVYEDEIDHFKEEWMNVSSAKGQLAHKGDADECLDEEITKEEEKSESNDNAKGQLAHKGDADECLDDEITKEPESARDTVI